MQDAALATKVLQAGGVPTRGVPRVGSKAKRTPSLCENHHSGARFATRPAVFVPFNDCFPQGN